MPHATLKLLPGVNQNRTPVLNEAGISTSQLIRFVPDDKLGALPQKLGGYQKFFSDAIGSIVRALWAWADVNSATHLAIGAESELGILSDGVLQNVTPRTDTDDVAVSLDTTMGSNVVTIHDTGSNITNYDSVWVKTQISIGGLIIFGLYQAYSVSADTYTILAVDALGNPALAASSETTDGAVPTFETTSGASVVTVNLDDHGLSVGDTFPILISLTLNGITLFGNYEVIGVTDDDTFTIQSSATANATTGSPVPLNGGDAEYVYYIGGGPLPMGTGYGIGGYGTGGYGTGGTPSANPGTPITATDWSLDNWGSILIANPFGGAIYAYDPLTNPPIAPVIPEAPVVNVGLFVAMPQRQIIAYGSTFNGIIDPLLVRWCDIENFFQWIALPTNQSGSYRLTRGSKIVGSIQGPQQSLLWTDVGLWSMQYIGQPYVYSFNEIGTGCGLIAQKAAGTIGGIVYWMGRSQFYMLSSNGIETVYCPIWDVIFQDLDTDAAALDKIRFAANSLFNEVSWYYPSSDGGGDVDKYVKYNTFLKQWDYGTLTRTAWINQSVLGPPIGADATSYIYQHETSPDADGQPMNPSFRTGFFEMNEAQDKVFVDQVWPDMKWGYFDGTQNANVQITFYYADYPGDTPRTSGPFTVTQTTKYVTPRFRARLMAIQIESDDIGSWWRCGGVRYRLAADGRY